jgi:hypothetical protein
MSCRMGSNTVLNQEAWPSIIKANSSPLEQGKHKRSPSLGLFFETLYIMFIIVHLSV